MSIQNRVIFEVVPVFYVWIHFHYIQYLFIAAYIYILSKVCNQFWITCCRHVFPMSIMRHKLFLLRFTARLYFSKLFSHSFHHFIVNNAQHISYYYSSDWKPEYIFLCYIKFNMYTRAKIFLNVWSCYFLYVSAVTSFLFELNWCD